MAAIVQNNKSWQSMIEEFKVKSLSGEKHKKVSTYHDRHSLSDPLKQHGNGGDSFQNWVKGVKERIINLYGPQTNPSRLSFDGQYAGGIRGHVIQLQQEINRSDISNRAYRGQISSIEAETSINRVQQSMRSLYKTMQKVAELARKSGVDWVQNGAQAGEVIRFPAIHTAVKIT